jgi:hypothetical protein
MTNEISYFPNTLVNISQQVISRDIDDETVLVNLETERIFTLNSTGARFWQLLGEGQKLDQISRQMQLEYEVNATDVEKEIGDLLNLLIEEGLVTIE